MKSKSLKGPDSPNVNSASGSTQGRVTFAKNVKTTTMPFTRSKRWMTKVKSSKKLYSRKGKNAWKSKAQIYRSFQ